MTYNKTSKLQQIFMTNITNLQNYAFCQLPKHEKLIIIWADKNISTVIMHHEAYIRQCIKEHPGNNTVYKNIINNCNEKVSKLNAKFDNFLSKNKRVLGSNALTFFKYNQKIHSNNIVCFCATAKIHKHPVNLRPIVAKIGRPIVAKTRAQGLNQSASGLSISCKS